MKKVSLTQIIIIAFASLVVGFIIGFATKSEPPSGEDLAGTIGKVDRFRNVKITEDDILLRNELADDTVKRAQYEKYLLYYYYQSLKTTSDVELVLSKTITVEEFDKSYHPYYDALSNFKVYLGTARTDILFALNLILSIDDNENVPVIAYLNQAQNAIARIRNHDDILMNYMDAIATFIEANPGVQYPALQDAHDILALNIMQSAILSQNKPVLNYLDKKKLMNGKEEIKQLASENNLNDAMMDQFAFDAERLALVNNEQLLGASLIVRNMEQLQGFVLNNMEQFNSIAFLGSEALQNMSNLSNQEQLQAFMSETKGLGFFVSDMEQIGSFFNSSENLR
ncbi:MAG: hypothetical protein Q8S18_00900 [Bacteroidales bacterium]|nr:hypothetical protein [Bacteroidales bacterium]